MGVHGHERQVHLLRHSRSMHELGSVMPPERRQAGRGPAKMSRVEEARSQFEEHGWVLVPSLVPASDVAAAQAQLFRIYPTPAEVASG